jgi:predicted GNAT family acetyltransferase
MDALFPAGAEVVNRIVCVQMTCAALTAADAPDDLDVLTLGEADAAEMFELAALTRPGPYRARTHALGEFIGVRRDGRLIAMAGQRLRLDGFTEISAVCTHPDHQGRGLARALMRLQAGRILAAGATPFLHAAHDNAGAIGLYESLGFRTRARIAYTVLAD